ncbi:L,D-transpeptidase family protein [Clostridium sp. MSJ-11]|uniref:L,D-transpeptidase family protein n=1 Tax=Clostridium mobile TaxID=2841512 RepID=A0ABS6EMB5_9CLOT|nr:L,D-transpeptidase family protein [Clostridium mobile]MBU5486375.1 L,D-transpeptidase family protein [Clostridium mobile]
MKKSIKIFILVFCWFTFLSSKANAKDNINYELPVIENTILKNAEMNFDNYPVYENKLIDYTINSNYKGEVNYRVFLRSLENENLIELTNGYTFDRDGEKPFKFYIFDIQPGNYDILIFAKHSNGLGSRDVSIGEYDIGYDDYKIIEFECLKNGEPKLDVSILNKPPYFENFNLNLKIKTKGYYGPVQYRVFLFSNVSKKWSEVTNGYSNQIYSTNEFDINTEKLKEGSYKLSVRVKRWEIPGVYNDSLGEYDDVKNIDITVSKKPIKKDSNSSAPTISELYVGNASETTRIMVRKDASLNSQIIGYIYGSTQEVKILGKKGSFNYVQVLNYGTSKEIKGYIHENYIKKVTPSKLYSIVVDITKQRVYVYKDSKLIKNFICSTGLDATPTPIGRFLIGDRGHSFGYEKGYICYDYVRFNYNYLFHSVLHDLNGRIIEHEYKRLGSKASNGCIRLEKDAAKWIYNNIPKNTLVEIKK